MPPISHNYRGRAPAENLQKSPQPKVLFKSVLIEAARAYGVVGMSRPAAQIDASCAAGPTERPQTARSAPPARLLSVE